MLKKSLVKAAVAALFVSGSVFSLQASGSIANGYEMDYYSDATYTEVVGNFTFECSNKRIMSGTKTNYSKVVLTWRC